jgi:hypothetical protein
MIWLLAVAMIMAAVMAAPVSAQEPCIAPPTSKEIAVSPPPQANNCHALEARGFIITERR